jgi:hypothetical protein
MASISVSDIYGKGFKYDEQVSVELIQTIPTGTVPALVGAAHWGPLNTPTIIIEEGDGKAFTTAFGTPLSASDGADSSGLAAVSALKATQLIYFTRIASSAVGQTPLQAELALERSATSAIVSGTVKISTNTFAIGDGTLGDEVGNNVYDLEVDATPVTGGTITSSSTQTLTTGTLNSAAVYVANNVIQVSIDGVVYKTTVIAGSPWLTLTTGTGYASSWIAAALDSTYGLKVNGSGAVIKRELLDADLAALANKIKFISKKRGSASAITIREYVGNSGVNATTANNNLFNYSTDTTSVIGSNSTLSSIVSLIDSQQSGNAVSSSVNSAGQISLYTDSTGAAKSIKLVGVSVNEQWTPVTSTTNFSKTLANAPTNAQTFTLSLVGDYGEVITFANDSDGNGLFTAVTTYLGSDILGATASTFNYNNNSMNIYLDSGDTVYGASKYVGPTFVDSAANQAGFTFDMNLNGGGATAVTVALTTSVATLVSAIQAGLDAAFTAGDFVVSSVSDSGSSKIIIKTKAKLTSAATAAITLSTDTTILTNTSATVSTVKLVDAGVVKCRVRATCVSKDGFYESVYLNSKVGTLYSGTDAVSVGNFVAYYAGADGDTIKFIKTTTLSGLNKLQVVFRDVVQSTYQGYSTVSTDASYIIDLMKADAKVNKIIDFAASTHVSGQEFPEGTSTFSGGSSGLIGITDTDYITAVLEYKSVDIYDFDIIDVAGNTAVAVEDAIQEVCDYRKDCYSPMDTPFGLVSNVTKNVQPLLDWQNGEAIGVREKAIDSKFMFATWPWVNIDVNGTTEWHAPSVRTIRMYCESDKLLGGKYGAPAGVTRGKLKEVNDIEVKLLEEDRNVIYADEANNRINPIAYSTADGFYVDGQKTSINDAANPLNRINVIKTSIFIKKQCQKFVKLFFFEPNDPESWNDFSRRIKEVVDYLIAARQIRNDGAYKPVIRCDASTNTLAVTADQGMVATIEYYPIKTIEKIKIVATVKDQQVVSFAVV